MAEDNNGEIPKINETFGQTSEFQKLQEKGFVVHSKRYGNIAVGIRNISGLPGGIEDVVDENGRVYINFNPESDAFAVWSSKPIEDKFSSGAIDENNPKLWISPASNTGIKPDLGIILDQMTDGQFEPKDGLKKYFDDLRAVNEISETIEENLTPREPEPPKPAPDLSLEPESDKIGGMPQEKGPIVNIPEQKPTKPLTPEEQIQEYVDQGKIDKLLGWAKLVRMPANWNNPKLLESIIEQGNLWVIGQMATNPEANEQWGYLGAAVGLRMEELKEQEKKKAEPEPEQKPKDKDQLAEELRKSRLAQDEREEESRLDVEIRQINQEIQASKRELEILLDQIPNLLGKIRSLTSSEAAQALRDGETIKHNIERLFGEINSAKDEIDTLKRMSLKDKKDSFERSRLSGKDFMGEVNRYQREFTELTDREKELRGKEDENTKKEAELNTEIGQVERDRVSYETELQKLSLRITSILDAIKNRQLVDAVQLTVKGESVRQRIQTILTNIGPIKTRIDSLSGLSFGNKKSNLEAIRIDISNIDNSIKLLTEETNLLNKDIETGKKKETVTQSELPKYVGAVFAEGAYSTDRLDALNIKRYSEDKSESEVRRFNVLVETERNIWLSRKIAKLQKGSENEMKIKKEDPDSWKDRANEWIEDFTKAADKAGFNGKEREDFLYRIYASIAVTLSARAMEASGGVFVDYARIIGASRTDYKDFFNPLFIIHGDKTDVEIGGVKFRDSNKIAVVLKDLPIGYSLESLDTWQLVTHFYQEIWSNAGVILDAKANILTGVNIETAKNSDLIKSLKSGDVINKGFDDYIKKYLKPEGSGQEMAAKMACDIFLSTIYTQWQAVIEPSLDKIDGKTPRLNASREWDGNPFMEFYNPAGFPIGIKDGLSTIRERFKGVSVPGYINNAVIPVDILPLLDNDHRKIFLEKMMMGNSVEDFKRQIRFDQALWDLFGNTKAESLPKLDLTTLGKLNEVADLYVEVFGDSKNRDFSRKIIAVSLSRIIRLKVELRIMDGIASGKPVRRGKEGAPALDEALKFFQGSLYNGEGGFITSVLGGTIGIDLANLDINDPLERMIKENTERVNDLLLTGELDVNSGEFKKWKESQKRKGFVEPLGKIGKGIGQIFSGIGLKIK